MDKTLIASMSEDERRVVTALHAEMGVLIDAMVESFGFDDSGDDKHREAVMAMAGHMERAVANLRPELMDDFNAVFDRITQAYFEPEKFFGFMDEYRDADGVVQLSPESISEFYGRSMALLTDVKSDFERRFAEL